MSIDFTRTAAFVAAVEKGRWTTYKDVAEAAGSAVGAQAIGDWLRRKGDELPHVYRVLNVEGVVPNDFRPAGPGVPADASTVRDVLRAEGVTIDTRGRAAPHQRLQTGDWT